LTDVFRAILKHEGLDVKFVLIDITDIKSITAAKEQIEKSEGRLDVLVNNAGTTLSTSTKNG
jgi:short-subunit dehydrogenase